jgi:trehalose 6-phosphate synthase
MVSVLGDRLCGTKLIVVANREPYIHQRHVQPSTGLWSWLRGTKETVKVDWTRPASGLVTALDPVMRACGGTWVAHGSGTADRETADRKGRLKVPPDKPSYTLRRVWMSPEEEQGYYYGLSNSALWPLCHIAYARPEFDEGDWNTYVAINRRFADAVLEEAGDSRAVVFVQDYHFALLPRFVKNARPDITVCQFWHIPWPNREAFRVCPWGETILDGMLGNDLLAFHLQYHCNNFLDTVDRTLESRVDYDNFSVWRGGRPTYVKPFPISIDPDLWAGPAKSGDRKAEVRQTRRDLGMNGEQLIVGVDRIDYTKGIPDRLKAFDRLLEKRREWRGRVTMLQIGAPSRDHLSRYKALGEEVEALVSSINTRYGTSHWKPIIFHHEHVTPERIATFYRAADVCVVSSLHDGMNLVAKEFIAARGDEQGVLLLSEFTGAARELDSAVLVNPYARDAFAEAMHNALTQPPDEQQRRMRALRMSVNSHTVYDWASALLQAAVRMEAVR